ncbi:MAG: tetratricopeptide repeat protein [Flavobacteriales bacterium]|nr:tetratricopeptide repeat protein [Flavobacteriales bacterium]
MIIGAIPLLIMLGTGTASAQAGARGLAWPEDTARFEELIRRSERHWALYQWDSAGSVARGALELAERWAERRAQAEGPDVQDAIERSRARSLAALGRVSGSIKGTALLDGALRIFRAIADRQGEATAHLYTGEIMQDDGRFVEAIRHVQQAIIIHEADGDTLKVAECTNTAGEYYRIMGDPSTALEYHLTALPVVMRLGASSAKGWNNILIGAVYRHTKNWPEALRYFSTARSIYEGSGDPIGVAIAYNDLGTAWFGSGQLDSARYWHSRALELRTRIGSFDGMGHSMRYLASIHSRQGAHREAITMLQGSEREFLRATMITSAARARAAIAEELLAIGENEEALAQMRSALDLLGTTSDRKYFPELSRQLATILVANGSVDQAIVALTAGIEHARAANDHAGSASCHHDLFKLHRERGDDERAYIAHRRYLSARDSARARSDESEVNRQMMKHDLEQDRLRIRAEDALQREERQAALDAGRQQQYLYLAGGSIFAVLAIGLFARLRYTARGKRRMEKQRRELMRAKTRAEQSEKFKERFLANMSHEIRTPMNAIMGMTGILRRNEHRPEQRPHLDAMAESADGLLHILNDILDMSKLDAGRLELENVPFGPARIVDQALATVRDRARAKGIRIVVDVAPQVPKAVLGDPTRVKQILENLLGNAIKFTSQGTVMVITTCEDGPAGRVFLNFSVKDTGTGIPADRLESIFEEFTKAYSTNAHKLGGTGLGLTISKRLVDLQHGTLTVESTVGAGSTFTARIPFDRASALDHGALGAPALDMRDLRILLADDNAFNVMVAQDELMDAIPGVQVDAVVNGFEAVALARTNHYDVVLMDVQMPEMNGYDAARAIRALNGPRSQVPILAMTANVIKSDLDRCIEAGMNGHVPKPFQRTELVEALSRALQSRERT